MRRRALERETDKLRERIDAKRLALAALPVTTAGAWFTGAGLALASGFMTGVSGSIPPQFDRDSFLRLLTRASAAAIAAAAAFVGMYPPDAIADDAAPPPGPPPPADPEPAGPPGEPVTRADLLQRLRLQSAGGGQTR